MASASIPGMELKVPPDISDVSDAFPSPIASLSPPEYPIGFTEPEDKSLIVSAGFMAFSPDLQKILLVRRKDSMAYVEFIRGKYKPKDKEYLRFLLSSMTFEEQTRLLHETNFDVLWSQMWIIKTTKTFTKNFEIAKHKFDSCIHLLHEWIPEFQKESVKQYRVEPEWGIPKGRRNRNEPNFHCALREFEEETGISTSAGSSSSSDLVIEYPSESESVCIPLEVEYLGTNCIRYKMIVFPVICHQTDVSIDPTNHHQQREISAVEWIPLDDAICRLKGLEVDYASLITKALNYFHRD